MKNINLIPNQYILNGKKSKISLKTNVDIIHYFKLLMINNKGLKCGFLENNDIDLIQSSDQAETQLSNFFVFFPSLQRIQMILPLIGIDCGYWLCYYIFIIYYLSNGINKLPEVIELSEYFYPKIQDLIRKYYQEAILKYTHKNN